MINSMNLYKRAAEGEEIYELVDFDKKLRVVLSLREKVNGWNRLVRLPDRTIFLR